MNNEKLTDEQRRILLEKGTEAPFSGLYNDYKGDGSFVCAGCGNLLFEAVDKFDSGSGWPSFTNPVSSNSVKEFKDISHDMIRTEVVCSKCCGHLGHVFPDGPPKTGLRYCINSVALNLKNDQENTK